MAQKTINDLTLKSPVVGTDLFEIEDVAGGNVSKKTALTDIRDYVRGFGRCHGVIGSADTDTAHDVQLSAGVVPDSTYAYDLVLSSAIAKQGDVTWAAGGTPGTPAGGLMGGTWTTSTEYGVFLIYNPTTGTVDAGFSVYTMSGGVAVPTYLPSGYTVYRMVDWVLTDGSSNIVQSSNLDVGGGRVRKRKSTPTNDIILSNTLTTTRRTDTIYAMTGFKCHVYGELYLYDGSAGFSAYVWDPDTADVAPSDNTNRSHYRNVGENFIEPHDFYTNTSRQVAARSDLATVDAYQFSVHSFEWQRY